MKFLATAFICVLPLFSLCQVDTVHVRQFDVVRSADAVIHTFTSPARWKQKDWTRLGIATMGAIAISALDEPVRKLMQSHQSRGMDRLERVGYHYGKPYSAVAFSGGFYLVGLVIKDEWARETGMMLASALTVNNALVGIMKSAIGRARPAYDLGPYHWEPLSGEYDYHSMPSGHTAVAMTISLVMAKRINSIPIKVIFYSLASITAASRLYEDAHWLSDVAVASTITWFGTHAVIQRIKKNRFRTIQGKKSINLALLPTPNGFSLTASW